MKIGNSEIEKLYIGEDEVDKLYLGTDLIYEKSTGPDYRTMPLTFEIISGGTIVWKAANTANTITIEYKKNDGAWTEITSSTGGTSISVVSGDTVQFRGDNATYTTTRYYNQSSFIGTTSGFIVYGNIMSMINSTNFANITTLESAWTFSDLFYNCTGLTDASKLILPATALTQGCYRNIFSYCVNLTKAPELPATTLANQCYSGMLAGCTSLTTAPELPATTLAESCYEYMFQGCSNLTTAPVLPALTLVSNCYDGMFRYCSSLNYIKCLATTDITQGYYTNGWVEGVPNSGGGGSSDSSSSSSSSDEPVPFEGGTFVKHPDNESWGFGYSDIPNGWTVEDAVL